MVIELKVINLIPPTEKGISAAKYIPMRIHQNKLFVVENMELEQCVDSKGKLHSKYSVAKYNGEYYKLLVPYEKLKQDYFTPIVVKGLGK